MARPPRPLRAPPPDRPSAFGAASSARRDADPSGMLAPSPSPSPSPAPLPPGGSGRAPGRAAADDAEDHARLDGTVGARLGIRDLRGQLTSLVRRAGTGERIVITIGGRPVAQLGPVEPASATVTIDDLVARGLLEPARRGDRPADPDVVIDTWTGRRLDHALREVRGA